MDLGIGRLDAIVVDEAYAKYIKILKKTGRKRTLQNP